MAASRASGAHVLGVRCAPGHGNSPFSSRHHLSVGPSRALTLMNRADGPFYRHQEDQPLDLTPAAEMNVITPVAAFIGARCRLAARARSEQPDQLRRVVEALTPPQKWNLHISPLFFCDPYRLVPSNLRARKTTRRFRAGGKGQQRIRQMPFRDNSTLAGQSLCRYEAHSRLAHHHQRGKSCTNPARRSRPWLADFSSRS